MAFWRIRANLASTIFPFATVLGGRSVIVPQFDQNYIKELVASVDADKDRGIPQAFYMHNCMPTSQGYQSIGYDEYIEGITQDDFDTIFPIQNVDLSRFLFVPAVGKNYIYDAVVGEWASVSPIDNLSADILCTTALVQAQSYIFYEGIGCFKYNSTDKILDPVDLIGLTIEDVRGITNANGYMIAWTRDYVAWNAIEGALDFTPSLVTGAGGGSLTEAKGEILFCLPISGGFIAYCEKNIVSARYTGNARYPYTFKELASSGGVVATPDQVSWQSNVAEHYAWTTAGLQKIDGVTCQNLIPEITDFLSMKYFEDFNEVTRTFTELFLSVQLNIKLNMISSRYLVISYGIQLPEYTHALIYDLSLKRWGKCKIQHRDAFQWNAPNLYGALTYGELTMTYGGFGALTTYADLGSSVQNLEYPRENLCFLQADGTVQSVNFDIAQTNANGVFMIGKFQLRRNRQVVHQRTEIESIKSGNAFSYYIAVTLDGKTLEPFVEGRLIKNSPMMKLYGRILHGVNFVGCYIGAFNLTSLVHEITEGGEY